MLTLRYGCEGLGGAPSPVKMQVGRIPSTGSPDSESASLQERGEGLIFLCQSDLFNNARGAWICYIHVYDNTQHATTAITYTAIG